MSSVLERTNTFNKPCGVHTVLHLVTPRLSGSLTQHITTYHTKTILTLFKIVFYTCTPMNNVQDDGHRLFCLQTWGTTPALGSTSWTSESDLNGVKEKTVRNPNRSTDEEKRWRHKPCLPSAVMGNVCSLKGKMGKLSALVSGNTRKIAWCAWQTWLKPNTMDCAAEHAKLHAGLRGQRQAGL